MKQKRSNDATVIAICAAVFGAIVLVLVLGFVGNIGNDEPAVACSAADRALANRMARRGITTLEEVRALRMECMGAEERLIFNRRARSLGL